MFYTRALTMISIVDNMTIECDAVRRREDFLLSFDLGLLYDFPSVRP